MHYSYDSRTYNNVILTILTVEDSWQEARVVYLCRGISLFPSNPRVKTSTHEHVSPINTTMNHHSDTVQCLFDVLLKMKVSFPKRLYQFIKLLLQLMSTYVIVVEREMEKNLINLF